jgi:predicted nucleic acid-binding protein
MKIDELLADTKRLYIDTAPLIYYIEEHPTYVAQMDAITAAIDGGEVAAYSSVITLTEVLTRPVKLGNSQLEEQYRHILLHSGAYHLIPVSTRIADNAARLRARYNLRTADALHVASAMDASCTTFLTNDHGIQRITDLSVVLLSGLDLTSP